MVVDSGRVPIIFTWYVPGGLNFDTKIFPVVESTPIRSVTWLRAFPFELFYPVYVQVLAYVPKLRVAEKGVIENY